MKLQDIELDLPYVCNYEYIETVMQNNGINQIEAKHLDYSNNWKEKRHQFRNQTRCVSSFFARMLKDFKNSVCRKIVIECYETVNSDSYKLIDHVLFIQVSCEVDSFFLLNDYEKRKLATSLIYSGFLKIGNMLSGLLDEFEKMQIAFKESNYENKWIWKSVKKKSLHVIIHVYHSNYDVKILAEVRTDNSNIMHELITTPPDEWYYFKYLYKLRMENPETIYLETVDNKKIMILGE